ncbi:antitoxin Xre/MbcA/ParS toxin-binding domain-containing protein [Halopseudomonas sp.]|uniref:antitoxin Xre/MbcA/ParS toxin-binding domain-containing protein n=1 Tax=Halopseudomonas sp. TaxID=2901191 RepID=UPI0039E52929
MDSKISKGFRMKVENKNFRPSGCQQDGIFTEIGLPERGQALFSAVNNGLDTHVFLQLASLLGSDANQLARWLGLSNTTLNRRLKLGRFNCVESDKMVRAAEVFSSAMRLFEGDRRSALCWMKTPLQALGSVAPIEMLKTGVESGSALNLIEQLEHGLFV